MALMDQHIEATPGVCGGKPRIAETRITVADVALMHSRLGQTPVEIAGKYELSVASVHAALAYYYDHQSEVDQSIREDLAFVEAIRKGNPSPLQEKLAALGRA